MKRLHQIVFGAIVVLLAPVMASSQINIPGQPDGSSPAPEKRIGAATATLLKHNGQDQITVQTDPLQLQGDTNNGIVLIANFISFGKTVVAPEAIDLEFISYFSRRRFAVNRKAQIFSDGKLLFTGTLTRNSSGRSLNGVMTEVMTLKLTYPQYLQVLSGSAPTLAFGGMKLAINQEALAALRDLKKSIEVPVNFP